MKYILSLIISGALAVSGYSQTRNVLVNSNNAVVSPTNFWSVDASNARTGLGLGTAATNPASAFQPSSATLSNLASNNAVNLTNLRATNIVGTIPASNIGSLTLTNISGTFAISNGGTGATNAATARTNLGLGASWLTNTVASDFRTAIGLPLAALTNTNASNFRAAMGLGASDGVAFDAITVNMAIIGTPTIQFLNQGLVLFDGDDAMQFFTNRISFFEPIDFDNSSLASATRTNLGLGWAALTNTSASGFGAALYGSNTNPVLVNTNGQVVSPTNFWQVAPIQILVQNTAPNTNSTNAATNARNLYIYSLATNIINVTNTITLPTNTSSFDGDEVTVIHRGGSNSVTAVRQLGSTNNLISLNSYDESVKFIKDGNWDFYHNISFTEAIRFSGTNAAVNAAASRTNLGLGEASSVTFQNVFVNSGLTAANIFASSRLNLPAVAGSSINDIWISNGLVRYQSGSLITSTRTLLTSEGNLDNLESAATARTNLGLGATNNVTFSNITASGTLTATGVVTTITNINVGGAINVTNKAETRTNLGLGSTNNVAFADIEITKTGTNSVYAKNDAGAFQVQIGTNSPSFAISSSSVDIVPSIIAYSNMSVDGDINVAGAISVTNAAATRTNLGIPLAALTNTNNANFQEAIFATNAAPTNAGNFGDHAAWMGVSIVTNGVTNVFRIPLYK